VAVRRPPTRQVGFRLKAEATTDEFLDLPPSAGSRHSPVRGIRRFAAFACSWLSACSRLIIRGFRLQAEAGTRQDS
jgi:hypothetical protein